VEVQRCRLGDEEGSAWHLIETQRENGMNGLNEDAEDERFT